MLGKAYASSARVLSTLVGGFALFNLVRKTASVGLNGIFVDMVAFYQGLFFPIIDRLRLHAPAWAIPNWDHNVIVLVVLMCGVNARSLSRHFEEVFELDSVAGARAPNPPIA